MGQPLSKEEEFKRKIEKAKKERAKFVYDRKKIGWDEFGNLRYGIESKKISSQLKSFIKAENANNEQLEEGATTTWHVVSSPWIAAWLAHVHLAKGKSPAPGPCRNDNLIEWDGEKYVARHGLEMSNQNGIGDYRRVKKETWDTIMKYYPRSGPEITMEYTPPKGGVVTNGYIDTSSWQVKNHPPPLDPVLKKKKKQLPKIDFSSLGSKLKRGGQGGEEKDEGEMKANDPSNVNSGGRASGGGTLFGQQMGYEGENIEDREPDSDDEDIHLPPPVRKSSASSAAAPVSNNISAKSIGSLEATSARQQRSKTEEERNQEVEDLLFK